MRPKEWRDSGQMDLLRARLGQIVDLNHALAKLGRSIDWGFLEERLGAAYSDTPGHPPLPTRLMARLAILKAMYALSDEALCDRWLENPYYQLFCGEEFFRHTLPFDRSSMTRWRQRMGEDSRIIADAGYKGHNAPPSHRFKVYTAGQKRGMTETIRREMRRRAAVEPVIGHLKADHGMGRNHFAGSIGDALNAVLAAVGYNFRRILNWLGLWLALIQAVLSARSPHIDPVQAD